MRKRILTAFLVVAIAISVVSERAAAQFAGGGAFSGILDYLRSVTVNIIPAVTNTYDLGSSAKAWKKVFSYTVSSPTMITPINIDSDADGVTDFKIKNDEFSPNVTLTKQVGSASNRFLQGEFYDFGVIGNFYAPNGIEFTGGEKIYQSKDGYINIDGILISSGLTGALPVIAGKNTKASILPKLFIEPINALTNGTTSTNIGYIDATPAGEWTGTDADIASSTATDMYKEGSASLRVYITDNASANDTVINPLGGGDQDWSNNEYVGFWFYSSISLAAGDLKFRIVDSGAGNSDTNFPAVVGGQWTWVTIDISAIANTSKDVVTDIAILYAVDVGSMVMYLDFMAKWDVTDAFALAQMPVTDGILSMLTVLEAAAGANDFTTKTEYTNYFIDYTNQKLVVITDESANTALITYAY